MHIPQKSSMAKVYILGADQKKSGLWDEIVTGAKKNSSFFFFFFFFFLAGGGGGGGGGGGN